MQDSDHGVTAVDSLPVGDSVETYHDNFDLEQDMSLEVERDHALDQAQPFASMSPEPYDLVKLVRDDGMLCLLQATASGEDDNRGPGIQNLKEVAVSCNAAAAMDATPTVPIIESGQDAQ